LLDGMLNLVPAGVRVLHAATRRCTTDASEWNELTVGGVLGPGLGLFTLSAPSGTAPSPENCPDLQTDLHGALATDADMALHPAWWRVVAMGQPSPPEKNAACSTEAASGVGRLLRWR